MIIFFRPFLISIANHPPLLPYYNVRIHTHLWKILPTQLAKTHNKYILLLHLSLIRHGIISCCYEYTEEYFIYNIVTVVAVLNKVLDWKISCQSMFACIAAACAIPQKWNKNKKRNNTKSIHFQSSQNTYWISKTFTRVYRKAYCYFSCICEIRVNQKPINRFLSSANGLTVIGQPIHTNEGPHKTLSLKYKRASDTIYPTFIAMCFKCFSLNYVSHIDTRAYIYVYCIENTCWS